MFLSYFASLFGTLCSQTESQGTNLSCSLRGIPLFSHICIPSLPRLASFCYIHILVCCTNRVVLRHIISLELQKHSVRKGRLPIVRRRKNISGSTAWYLSSSCTPLWASLSSVPPTTWSPDWGRMCPSLLTRIIASSHQATLSLSPFSFLQSGAMRLASAEWL